MRVIKTLTLIACSLFLSSCLKAVTEDIPLDYIPRAQSVRSGPFLADGDDLLIVTVNGATLQPVLERGHFSLTRDNRDVPLPVPVRGGDGYVLFGFDQPLERSHNFRLTVRPAAGL